MSNTPPNPYSLIPGVDTVLFALEGQPDLPPLPLPLLTAVVRREIAGMREGVKVGNVTPASLEDTMRQIRKKIDSLYRSRIHPVINGTGICIHTNLGRSPLQAGAMEAIAKVGSSYNNIELNLETGERGERGGFLELSLATLCEAEAATVTNNCAAALILILKHLANGERNEVIISRGELVEIGGGFRVPEIMAVSGAQLVEVGATNKTSLEDYAQAITTRTGMLLKVHRSNFYMEGFTSEPTIDELVALGQTHGIPVVEDLGSGAMLPMESLAPLPHEPTATEVLHRGVSLVCISGDKLFGGPQAGIILGKADLIAGLKKEPFFRALRCDKLVLTGMQETVLAYLRSGTGHGARPDLPLISLLSASVDDDLRPRGEAILRSLADSSDLEATLIDSIARCGGGTMPKAVIPSLALSLKPLRFSVARLAQRLRKRDLPVMGYITDDSLRLDLRTIFPAQDKMLLESLLSLS